MDDVLIPAKIVRKNYVLNINLDKYQQVNNSYNTLAGNGGSTNFQAPPHAAYFL